MGGYYYNVSLKKCDGDKDWVYLAHDRVSYKLS
jgi:hypothetical protein